MIEYYTPGIRAEVIGSRGLAVPRHGKVFLLASFLDQPASPETWPAPGTRWRTRVCDR